MASDMAVSAPARARNLGQESMGVSVAGMIITLFIVIIAVAINVDKNN